MTMNGQTQWEATKERLASDPAFRETMRRYKREYAERQKALHPERWTAWQKAARERHRERYANDPAYHDRRRAQNREGMRRLSASPEWKARNAAKVRARRSDPTVRAQLNARRREIHDPDCKKAQRHRYRAKDPLHAMLMHKRQQARREGMPFSLTVADFPAGIPHACPVLGIALDPFGGVGAHNVPSFDRVLPGRGYVSGNVRIISLRANILKRDCVNPAELEAVARYIRETIPHDATTEDLTPLRRARRRATKKVN
jgi:hypothetical protein